MELKPPFARSSGDEIVAPLDIYVARQPIFDRDQNVYAYELLYRSDRFNRAVTPDDRIATLKVLANVLSMGLEALTGGKRAFVHFDPELIMAGLPHVMPKELLGVEILNLKTVHPLLLRMCRQMKNLGYPIMVDSVVLASRERNARLIELADIVRVDFSPGAAAKSLALARSEEGRRVFLAEKIESHELYRQAMEAGCRYFQGFFFQQPDIIAHSEMAGSKRNYMQVLRKIHEPELDVRGIEELVRRDVSLTYKLLKFINSATYGFRVTVRSISHALVLLGGRELKKWLTIIVMSGAGRDKPAALMEAAAIRARWCELMAVEFHWRFPASDYFLLGMFSLVEAFLDRSMGEILSELPLEEHVAKGLLGKDAEARDILAILRGFERGDWEMFTGAAVRLGADADVAARLYREAVAWVKLLSD